MDIFNLKSFVIFSLVLSSFSAIAEDAALTSQKSACSGKASMEWSSTLNRCVTKKEAFETKNAVAECNKIEDVEQRKTCHLNIANSKAALGESAEGSIGNLDSGATRSALVNGANTVISVLNLMASGDGTSKNTCMSKNILAAAAIGGTVTDILMKIKMKKASEELQKKYEVSKNDSAYTAQYKALEYLRDGQKVVKDIADWEVKRQTLLMIGYGAAMATGIWEATSGQSKCTGDEGDKKPTPEPSAVPSPTASAAPVAEPSPAPVTAASPAPVTAPSPAPVTAPSPAPVVTKTDPAPTPTRPDPTIQYSKDGKTTYMIQKDNAGNVIGVYHGGKDGAYNYYEGSSITKTSALSRDDSPIYVVKAGSTPTSTTNKDDFSFFKRRGK